MSYFKTTKKKTRARMRHSKWNYGIARNYLWSSLLHTTRVYIKLIGPERVSNARWHCARVLGAVAPVCVHVNRAQWMCIRLEINLLWLRWHGIVKHGAFPGKCAYLCLLSIDSPVCVCALEPSLGHFFPSLPYFHYIIFNVSPKRFFFTFKLLGLFWKKINKRKKP